jgi:hypothetical protein
VKRKEGGWHGMAVMGQPERRNWDFGDELGENGCGVAEMDVVKERKAGEAAETARRVVVEAKRSVEGVQVRAGAM